MCVCIWIDSSQRCLRISKRQSWNLGLTNQKLMKLLIRIMFWSQCVNLEAKTTRFARTLSLAKSYFKIRRRVHRKSKNLRSLSDVFHFLDIWTNQILELRCFDQSEMSRMSTSRVLQWTRTETLGQIRNTFVPPTSRCSRPDAIRCSRERIQRCCSYQDQSPMV